MKKSFKKIGFNAGVTALAVLTLSGVGYVFAQPTTAPGAGPGVYLPLNVGPDAQTKAGSLTVSELCLGGVCKTEWPGTNVPATLSGAQFPSISTYPYYGNYCNGYYQWTSLSYYQNGNPATGTYYNCGPTSFSVSIPSSLPAGATIGQVTNSLVWCHGGTGNYSIYNNPSLYITDTYYPFRTQATNVTATLSGANIVVTGDCTFVGNSNVYMGVRVEAIDVLYNQ